MTLVVDASVAVKWFVEEVDSAQARELLNGDERIIAPELIVPEVCNAAWKLLRAGRIPADQAARVAQNIAGAFDSLWQMPPLAPRAVALASLLDHPVYDCFYLSLAEAQGATLVTEDRRLLEVLRGTSFSELATSLNAPA